MYKSDDNWRQSIEATNQVLGVLKIPLPELTMVKGKIHSRYLQCPFCVEIEKGSESAGRGNIHHHHLSCKEPTITTAQTQLLNAVEGSCKNFWNHVTDMVGYQRAAKFLAELKQELWETEMTMAKSMSKQCNGKSRDVNISIIENSKLNSPN